MQRARSLLAARLRWEFGFLRSNEDPIRQILAPLDAVLVLLTTLPAPPSSEVVAAAEALPLCTMTRSAPARRDRHGAIGAADPQ